MRIGEVLKLTANDLQDRKLSTGFHKYGHAKIPLPPFDKGGKSSPPFRKGITPL
jgi:hypothetical protein